MSFLTGKASKSENKAYPWIQSTFGGDASGLVNSGQSALATYLGQLNGTDNGAGYAAYKDSTGYKDIFDEAIRGVTGSAAARGLLASGSTVRGVTDRAGQLAQQNYANYLQQLLGGAQTGIQGGTGLANVIAGAGQVSTGAKKGFLDYAAQIGQAAGSAAALSDRRLKKDISLIDRLSDGLGIYRYRYIGEDEPRIGVMADEVAEIRPWALGEPIQGYATVKYGEL